MRDFIECGAILYLSQCRYAMNAQAHVLYSKLHLQSVYVHIPAHLHSSCTHCYKPWFSR